MIDQQHRRRPRQGMISGAPDGYVLTVADMLDAIHNLPDDAESFLGPARMGNPRTFSASRYGEQKRWPSNLARRTEPANEAAIMQLISCHDLELTQFER
jgi:hypothetical protein